MAISPLVRPLCLFLGTVGLVQGLIFFTLSLLGVLVHLCTITVDPDETLSSFIPLIVGLYFQGPECQVYNTTVLYNNYYSNLVTPKWLFVWMAIYLGVSGVSIIFSILIMMDYLYKTKTLHYVLSFWIILTLGNCGMDLVLAAYFGLDYTDLLSNTQVNGTSLLPVVPFAMMILSIRGGVLWLFNFFGSMFAIVAFNHFINHKDDGKPLFLERAGFLDRSPIEGFAPIEMPRPATLSLNANSNNRSIGSASALHKYYMNHQDQPRSNLQSPIADVPVFNNWRKPTVWDNIPDPDYSPISTVTRLKNETDSQSTPGLRHILFNPTLPLRPSLKKTQHTYERKELDISI